jgi:endonuclease/exonuclease/phosphatase family metal-dependent hydrolase
MRVVLGSRSGRRRGARLVAVAAVLALVAGACTGSSDDDPSSSPSSDQGSAASDATEPMQLTVMVDNIEYEGGPATDEAMRVVDADIVGVLESYNRLPEIARKTGYPYYNVALQVLSKFPIHEPSEGDGLYGLVEVRPGEVVAVFNVHLDYVKRGRNKLLAGMELDDVIALENEVRTSALEVQVGAMTRLIEEGVPVFLTGDFNQPSSLDYTAETVGTRPGIDEPIPWPVSEMLFDLGFRDSYREIHPDPVETPGITHLKSEDRIDYVYAAGPSTTLDSQVVGEEGGPDVEIELPEWTSDHRAVLSTFEVTPAPMPTMVSVNARLQNVGDTITVAYHGAGGEIAIVPEGEGPSAAVVTLDAPGDSGTAELETGDLDPTGYDAVLVDDSGAEVARVAFWLRDSEAEVKLSTDKATYAEGEPITVSWEDGPANRWDWIGVYEADAADPEVDDYLVWAYTGLHESGTVPPTVSGSLALSGASPGSWPLPPGRYVVHYLVTDQYISAGTTSFRVEG